MAASLLLHTIFGEEQEGLNEKFPDPIEPEEVDMTANNETTAAIDRTVEPSFPTSNRARSMGKNRISAQPTNEANGRDDLDKKQKKEDQREQVDRLFELQPVANNFDMNQKRLVFKLANDTKDVQNKADVDSMFKRLMTMNDRTVLRQGTKEPLVASKQQMIEIIETLERDNLLMYAAEDNRVILM